jgi:hypothetical protein
MPFAARTTDRQNCMVPAHPVLNIYVSMDYELLPPLFFSQWAMCSLSRGKVAVFVDQQHDRNCTYQENVLIVCRNEKKCIKTKAFFNTTYFVVS